MTTTTTIRFPNASGQQLSARLQRPDGTPRGWCILAHCFTCSKDLKPLGYISAALLAHGVGVLRFDFTGLGQSEGQFEDTNFSSNLEDLLAAAEFFRAHEVGPLLLVGHSLGGAAALAVAHRIPEVVAVATIGAPSDPEHVVRHLEEHRHEIESRGEAEVEIAGRSFRIRRQLLDDLAAHTLEEHIENLGRPLLVLHSPADEVVSIENGQRIFEEQALGLHGSGAEHFSRSSPGEYFYAPIPEARFQEALRVATGEDAGISPGEFRRVRPQPGRGPPGCTRCPRCGPGCCSG